METRTVASMTKYLSTSYRPDCEYLDGIQVFPGQRVQVARPKPSNKSSLRSSALRSFKKGCMSDYRVLGPRTKRADVDPPTRMHELADGTYRTSDPAISVPLSELFEWNMQTGTMLSVSEYRSTSYRPDCEYLDGIILERNLGERDHSGGQMSLSGYLFIRKDQWGIHIFPEQRVQLKPTRFRVPDVCVIAGPKPAGQIFTQRPFLCMEIMSKDDRMSEMLERIDDYFTFGVPFVWLLDPRTHRAHIYRRGEIREVTDGLLRTTNPISQYRWPKCSVKTAVN